MRHRWIELAAFVAVLLVWFQVTEAVCCFRSYSEYLLFQNLTNSFSYAPVPYCVSLLGSFFHIRRGGRLWGLSEVVLVASLPLAGVWIADHLPGALGFEYNGLHNNEIVLTSVIAFFIPAFIAVIVLRKAKKACQAENFSRNL